MSNSGMVSHTRLSPNHSGPRNAPITKITPHYMAGNLSVESCGELFASPARRASSNYGIGSDGRVALYVDEANRAWTSGSSWNDNRAVTIECANLPDGSLTDACWSSLVALCADICRRNGITDCSYTGNADGTLTMHRWFQATDCPGPWLSGQFARLSAEVDALLGGKADVTGRGQEGDEMVCIIRPNGEGYLEYFDGARVHPLHHPDEVTALDMAYQATHGGAHIPCLAMGTKDAPWATRLHDAIGR